MASLAYHGAEVGAEGSPDDRDGDGAGDDVLRTHVQDPAFPGRDGPGAPRRQAGSSDDGARPRRARTAAQQEHNARMDRERRAAQAASRAAARREDAVDKTLGAVRSRRGAGAAPYGRGATSATATARTTRRATVLVHYCSYCSSSGLYVDYRTLRLQYGMIPYPVE